MELEIPETAFFFGKTRGITSDGKNVLSPKSNSECL
jgi:hypothetical protein